MLPLDTLRTFHELGVDPPAGNDDVLKTIAAIEAKKKEFEEKRDKAAAEPPAEEVNSTGCLLDVSHTLECCCGAESVDWRMVSERCGDGHALSRWSAAVVDGGNVDVAPCLFGTCTA